MEKRLELVKQVSHSTHKKLTACLQGQQGVDADKRSVRPWQGAEGAGQAAGGSRAGRVGNAALSLQKKLPLTTLAQCLMEGSAVLGDDSLLG